MEVLLALTGRDYTLLATSRAAMRGATILSSHDNKTRQLSDHLVLAYSGEAGDTVQFAEYIQANTALYAIRNSHVLSPGAAASFTRGELARALRSRSPYQVNLLLAGVELGGEEGAESNKENGNDNGNGNGNGNGAAETASETSTDSNGFVKVAHPGRTATPKLYWIDYLASMAEVPYAAHGYAQFYCLSILDKHHQPDMTLERGIEVLRMCTEELRRRLPIDYKGVDVRVVDGDGVRKLEYEEDLNTSGKAA